MHFAGAPASARTMLHFFEARNTAASGSPVTTAFHGNKKNCLFLLNIMRFGSVVGYCAEHV